MGWQSSIIRRPGTPTGCKPPARGNAPGPRGQPKLLWPVRARKDPDPIRSFGPPFFPYPSASQGRCPWLQSSTPLGSPVIPSSLPIGHLDVSARSAPITSEVVLDHLLIHIEKCFSFQDNRNRRTRRLCRHLRTSTFVWVIWLSRCGDSPLTDARQSRSARRKSSPSCIDHSTGDRHLVPIRVSHQASFAARVPPSYTCRQDMLVGLS